MVINSITRIVNSSECCGKDLSTALYVYECAINAIEIEHYQTLTHGPGSNHGAPTLGFDNSTEGVLRVLKNECKTEPVCGMMRSIHWIYVCDTCMKRLGYLW